MLVPDPKAVRKLLTRYASLRIEQAQRARPAPARELDDVSFTLCVLMGATDVDIAVAKADALLAMARSAGDVTSAPREGGVRLAV
ncbi:DUF5133 domain-containing protein [Streptomyces sp. GESEQ-35]|uniref:DUF5133 domain-containing protein n=1 Tax=Streptomyces sp. GESEQ-35 TaxID=2812657 RepID=UPI001B31DE22|nr:DUF5133 domain-containing protein [Streptomyces sp. GESEQ-35]